MSNSQVPHSRVPRKHAELIKAWADGAEIQFKDFDGDGEAVWIDLVQPVWTEDVEYRIKPETKPDLIVHSVVEFRYSWKSPYLYCSWSGDECPAGYKHNLLRPNAEHLRYVFDTNTGKLKSVEIIK